MPNKSTAQVTSSIQGAPAQVLLAPQVPKALLALSFVPKFNRLWQPSTDSSSLKNVVPIVAIMHGLMLCSCSEPERGPEPVASSALDYIDLSYYVAGSLGLFIGLLGCLATWHFYLRDQFFPYGFTNGHIRRVQPRQENVAYEITFHKQDLQQVIESWDLLNAYRLRRVERRAMRTLLDHLFPIGSEEIQRKIKVTALVRVITLSTTRDYYRAPSEIDVGVYARQEQSIPPTYLWRFIEAYLRRTMDIQYCTPGEPWPEFSQ